MTHLLRRPERLMLILGIQRSGSTWLANIFDHREDTLLFMEPFAPYAGIFPETPQPGVFLDVPCPQLGELLGDPLVERLARLKTLWGTRAAIDPRWFRLERRAARWLQRVLRWLPGPGSRRLRRRLDGYELVNLNRLDPTFPLCHKHQRPPIWVIKELRLAGWTPVLRAALPNVPKLVIVRDPMASVHSILSWFERGRLHELRADIDRFLDVLSAQRAGDPYRALIDRCRRGALAHRVALYWRVHNETLVRGLRDSDGFHLVPYEQLAREPVATARRIFAAAGLSPSSTAEAYIAHSSSTGKRALVTSPTDTNRDSIADLRRWQEHGVPDVRDAVDAIVEGSFLLPLLEPTTAPRATSEGDLTNTGSGGGDRLRERGAPPG